MKAFYSKNYFDFSISIYSKHLFITYMPTTILSALHIIINLVFQIIYWREYTCPILQMKGLTTGMQSLNHLPQVIQKVNVRYKSK
jgi:hypothetical protein